MKRDIIVDALKAASGEKEINLEFPENQAHGDYATNVALKIKNQKSKIKSTNQRLKLKESRSSRELAEEIAGKLRKDKDLQGIVAKIEVAGPGFINFFLSKKVLIDNLQTVVEKGEKYGSSNLGQGKTVIIDYSSPNIAKYFAIGHLRSTIIGQALYNIYGFLGYKMIGENHLGDWGTQFGMLIAQVVRKNLDIEKLKIADLERLYVEFNQAVEKRPELAENARVWFKKLEQGDKEARKIWQAAVEISSKEFKRIYKLLGVEIENWHGESFYENKTQVVIKEVREKGLSKKSQEAEIIEFDRPAVDGAGPPSPRLRRTGLPAVMLLKSDGATTYFTRDLAALKFRIKTWKPEIIIYEVGADQKLHFQQLFRIADLLGWVKGRKFVHIAHGLIRFEHGKMSTRRGQTVKLEKVLVEAIQRARKIIEESGTGSGLPRRVKAGLSEKEKERISRMVGIGAIKYFDLSHHYSSDIIFDWEKLFVLTGNSGPYLQYTCARTQSVLAKIKNLPVRQAGQKSKIKTTDEKSNNKNSFDDWDLEINDEESLLLRSLGQFPEIIIDVAKNYSPNLLCNYLFELAQKYNTFYERHRILNAKAKNKEQSAQLKKLRIAITMAVSQVLKNGLTLLGIESPERM